MPYSFDAHKSSVGDVFDVAHFSRFKSVWMGVVGLVFAGGVALGAVYFWNPDWLVSEPSEFWAEPHQEAKQLLIDHPVGGSVGIAVAALIALVFFTVSASSFFNAANGDFYIRSGADGISFSLPDGFFGTFRQDFAWADVEQMTVIQEKQLGSMSRNAGNTGGELRLRLSDGSKHDLRLDEFREDAWLIHKRIVDSRELQAAIVG